jgi:hypothetical protein
MPSDLLTFDEAKAHLRVLDSGHDAEIQRKLAQASAIVRDYLKADADPAWDAATTPLPVQAATLLLLTSLYEHRGDDGAPSDYAAATWGEVERLLVRFRSPAIA